MSDSRGVPKRCADCKWRAKGTAGMMQWCDRCGGEMRTVRYGPGRPQRKGSKGIGR